MDRVFGVASGGGSLDIEQLTESAEELRFNVTKCQYADFFKELGLPKLGYLFSCNRDFAMAGWWSKAVQLDLEAKGVIARESSKPLRWYRNSTTSSGE